MVAPISTEAGTATEDSTAAPDTPGSSDVSAPSAGGNGAARRNGAAHSGRMSRVKEVHPTAAVVLRECKDGSRSVPLPSNRQAAQVVLQARPVTEAVSSSARGTRAFASTGTERRGGTSGTRMAAQGRSAPCPSGPPHSLAGRSPGRSPNSKRSPNRSTSPSSVTGGASGRLSPSGRRKEQELLEQKALLEIQISDATRSQMLLQRMLDEERSRGAADRAKLAALGARIEQLERTRQSGPRLLEENQTLYTELEAQSQQIEILRQQVQLLRDGHGQAAVADDSNLREENLRLRRDLELSRAMLSRYTEELATIMPGMQKVLQKFNSPDVQPRTLEVEPQEAVSSMSSTAPRPLHQDVAPEGNIPDALPVAPQQPPARLPVAPVEQEAPASFLAARKHQAAQRAVSASTSPQRKVDAEGRQDRSGYRASSPGVGKGPMTLGRVAPPSAGRLCNRLVDEAASRSRATKGAGIPRVESAPRRSSPAARRRSTSPQGTEDSAKPRWQF